MTRVKSRGILLVVKLARDNALRAARRERPVAPAPPDEATEPRPSLPSGGEDEDDR